MPIWYSTTSPDIRKVSTIDDSTLCLNSPIILLPNHIVYPSYSHRILLNINKYSLTISFHYQIFWELLLFKVKKVHDMYIPQNKFLSLSTVFDLFFLFFRKQETSSLSRGIWTFFFFFFFGRKRLLAAYVSKKSRPGIQDNWPWCRSSWPHVPLVQQFMTTYGALVP